MEPSGSSPVPLDPLAARKARFMGLDDQEIAASFAVIESSFERGRAMRGMVDHVPSEGIDPPQLSYAIAMTFRTGSTLLKDWLASTGVLGRPDEHLNRFFLDHWSAALRADRLVPYLQATARVHQTPNRVFGTKVEFRQFLPAILEDGLERAGIDPRWVYVERHDLLGQAISLAKAHVTQSWNSTEPPQSEPRFDEEAVVGALKSITRQRQLWERYFALIGVNPLRLTYEDMIEDPTATVRAVAAHVGVEVELLTEAPTSPMEIQRDAVNDEWAQSVRARFSAVDL
jgi:LPS sulfotransferase NodH